MKLFSYIKVKLKLIIELHLYNNTRQKDISEFQFKKNIIKSKEYAPVFFLSTGRTGTLLFTELLEKSKKTKIFHSPSALFCNAQSELIEQGKVVYEMYEKYGLDDERTNELAAQIIMASREDLLFKTYLHDKVYIETNNRITFFAPAIKKIFPNAKFVHLHRHPGEFIRSGVRRKYYVGNDNHQIGMIKPVNTNIHYETWESMDNIEKVSWLWNETNNFIDTYLQTLGKKDYFQFNFNNLTVNNIEELFSFLNIDDISLQTIQEAIYTPVNVEKNGSFEEYSKWNNEDKEKVKSICGRLSLKYRYEL